MTGAGPIRVVIVDDHALVRGGLEQVLAGEGDIAVVGTAADGRSGHELTVREKPDVVLMDLSMPVLDGIAATRLIAADAPGVHVVVLTSFAEPQRVLDALEAGAIGYVLKDADPTEVVGAVRAAAAGESPLDPKAARVLLDARRSPRPTANLTDRETEVLRLVAEGLPNKHIARRLGITERTVKAHLTKVFAAIGVADRTQAALWARENLR